MISSNDPSIIMTHPRVSVVIPVRNGKDYLQEALDSVLQQSFTDLELLLINDGSSDDDYDRYALQDRRIRVIHLAGSGVSRARNIGMAQSRGEFIAFLDADDVWFPGKLEAQVRYFDVHPEAGVVFGKFIRWPALPGGEFAPANSLMKDVKDLRSADPERSGWLYARLLKGLLVGMNTAVIRRSVYHAIGGFNESMRQSEDYDFWLKSSRLSEMHSLNEPVALYRIHEASAMHKLSDENHLANLINVATLRWSTNLRKGDEITPYELNRRLGEAHFMHGYAHYWNGEKLIARKSFTEALSSGYKRTRSLAYLILCSVTNFFKIQPLKKKK